MANHDDSQLTQGDLASMDVDEITQAKAEGRLNVLLGMDPAVDALLTRAKTEPLSPADIETLSGLHQYDLIAAANREGRINHNQEIR
jgi:hypothetical protein